MTEHPQTGRRKPTRRVVGVVAGMLAALVAPLVLSIGDLAKADTVGSPDPTVTATVGAQSGVAPATTLTALHDGTPVSITVTAPSNLAGVDARQCWGGATNIQLQAQFNPTQGGNCVDVPLSAGSDDFVSTTVGAPNTTVTFPFRVGEGTRNVVYGANNRDVICNAATNCTLWLKIAVLSGGDGAGAVWKHYNLDFAGPATVPQNVTAVPGNQSVNVDWDAPAANGGAPITSYDVTLTGGVTPVTQNVLAPATSFNFTGLTNFTTYSATVLAKSTAADAFVYSSPASAPVSATPGPAGPTAFAASPRNAAMQLSWTAPSGPAPASYDVVYCARSAAATACTPTTVVNTGDADETFLLGSLANGTVYDLFVRAVYSAGSSAPSATITATPNSTLITQTITVTRPQGALVLTQVCGARGAITTGTAPTYQGGPDPLFGGYPYPEDANGAPVQANYPTDCALPLGSARLITNGAGAGQFFRAAGVLNQVTVVDARDTDDGWAVNAQMGTFTSGTNSFSGGQMGWDPIVSSTTGAFTDASGNTYDQTVAEGSTIAANTSAAAGGLADPRALASAAAGQGLGIARLDADLTLLIPIFAISGQYTGVLTITAI